MANANNLTKFFWLIAFIVFAVCSYFLIRSLMYFLFVIIITLVVMYFSELWYTGKSVAPILSSIVCVICLIFVHQKVSLWGELYEEKVESEKIIQAAKDETNAIFEASNYLISSAEIEIERKLKDPDSATYSNERVSKKSGVDVACGNVSSKNSFGGMVRQRYISNGSPAGTFLEEEVKDFQNLWNTMCY